MESYERGPPQRALAGGVGGSVRRAREQMLPGPPPGYSAPLQRQVPESSAAAAFREPRTAPSPPRAGVSRPRGPMPAALQAAMAPGQSIGVAISRPIAKSPQWPLNGSNTADPSRNEITQQYPQSNTRVNPVPPPAQPRYAPPLFDQSGQEEGSYGRQAPTATSNIPLPMRRPRQWPDEVEAPEMSSPISPVTPASRQSTVSSVGTIPDFPIPAQLPSAGPPRRSANLGPPPSSRRGASSYYSNISYVSPIPEESDRSRSHGSYASSNAIPSSWGDESPRYDFYDQESPVVEDIMEEDRESRDSNYDDGDGDGDERGLVRSASVGRRGKPSMVTTKSAEKAEQVGKAKTVELKRGGDMTAPTMRQNLNVAQPSNSAVWPIMDSNINSPLAGGTGLIESSSSSETIPTISGKPDIDGRLPPSAFQDPKAREILTAHEAASALGQTEAERRGFSKLSAIRRPPKLDIDAVRDAEARGSLTSLPDLIRRATRLATMIDSGRRPASRLNSFHGFPSDEELAGRAITTDEKRGSSLSGMLAAFPPPGAATPQKETIRPQSVWPTAATQGYDASSRAKNRDQEQEQPQKRGRRCCGLPVWAFVFLMLGLLIIIAAAVFVPLGLLVFKKKPNSGAAQNDLSACQASITCNNGGTAVVVSGVCSCICTNGFTGSTCSTAGNDGCAAMDMTSTPTGSSLNNVTIGSAITRLILQGPTNFSIPLSASAILARFSTANLSCSTENTLVTFNGAAVRQGDIAVGSSAAPSSDLPATTANAKLIRDIVGVTIVVPGSTLQFATTIGSTSNSIEPTITSRSTSINPTIVFDSSAFTTTTTSLSTSSSSTPTRTSSAKAPVSTVPGSFVVSEKILDFARVVTLYVLQQESLDLAISAQNSMQTFFSSGPNGLTTAKAGNVTLGTGLSKKTMTVDFEDLSVNLGNGSIGGAANNMGGKRALPVWVGL